MVHGLWFRVQGSGFRVQGLGFRGEGLHGNGGVDLGGLGLGLGDDLVLRSNGLRSNALRSKGIRGDVDGLALLLWRSDLQGRPHISGDGGSVGPSGADFLLISI